MHTLCSIVFIEKITGFQLVKKFPIFYRTRRFIIAFMTARHLSLSWASSIQSMTPKFHFLKTHTHTHTHTYIYIYIYTCVCVFVCVCVCVCVCVHMFFCHPIAILR